jgi:hypothetical protein
MLMNRRVQSLRACQGGQIATYRRICGALLIVPVLLLTAHAQVRFDRARDSIAVNVNGKPFTVFHFGKTEHKPFLHPLLTPSGKNILRGFPVTPLPGDSTDRPHQRGCWIGTEGLTGPSGMQDFWENDPAYPQEHKAQILLQEVTRAENGTDRGVLAVVNNWVSQEGQTWLVERRTMTFYSKPTDSRMFDIDIELEAAEPVTFDDVQDAVMGFRLALPFDSHYDGKVVNASGAAYEEAVRGRSSPWIDWTAELNPREYQHSPHGHGEKVGIAVFDHPSNLNYPARWQVKDFGDFSINPFGGTIFQKFDKTAEERGYSMKRGDKLHLRYRILIHPGDAKVEPVAKEWQDQK